MYCIIGLCCVYLTKASHLALIFCGQFQYVTTGFLVLQLQNFEELGTEVYSVLLGLF
jgi:hypothetical protein